MSGSSRSNLVIGAAAIVFAAIVLFLWIPFDSASGIVETVRRRIVIGDGMAPSLAAGFVALGGLLLLAAERRADRQPRISADALVSALWCAGLLAVALVIMRWAGPLAAMAAGEDYRLLRDSYPWKLIGFWLGGTFLVAAFVARAERRLGVRTVLVALLATAALIAIYDLPFDDLLLPPNGDV